MDITDDLLLGEIIEKCEGEGSEINYGEQIKKEFGENINNTQCKDHPLDEDVKKELKKLKEKIDEGEEISYEANDEINKLWIMLIKKSIMCLRFFDKREPFQEKDGSQLKLPEVYGLEDLVKYHEKYCDFESILYGGDLYYRDHIFHAIRCWMLGIYTLLSDNQKLTNNGEKLINNMHIEGESVEVIEKCNLYDLQNNYDLKVDLESELAKNPRKNITTYKKLINDKSKVEFLYIKKTDNNEYEIKEDNFSNNINILEKISMWTIIALCHDLGYPLEKSTKILDKTKEMMGVFVAQPKIWSDINFNGVQDNINDYIIKFMSSKMKEHNSLKEIDKNYERAYLGRIQPKYYLKYTKSLEHYSHGIISSIIVYKMLIYFMEADNNLNDDYIYKQEDARQFYIRREILRAMASHTCRDIYQMELTTFTSLLFLCDEMQEWGRKSWKNMYEGTPIKSTNLILKEFNDKKIDYIEEIQMDNATSNQICDNISRIFKKQYILYKTTFRDGQYTAKRNFDIHKTMKLNINKKFKGISYIEIKFEINHNDKDSFKLTIYTNGDTLKEVSTCLAGDLKDQIGEYKNDYKCDDIDHGEI